MRVDESIVDESIVDEPKTSHIILDIVARMHVTQMVQKIKHLYCKVALTTLRTELT